MHEFKNVDFSEAHFLDHSLWACIRDKDQPNRFGGVVTHVRYAWTYRWKSSIRGATLCRIGRHRKVKGYQRNPDTGRTRRMVICHDCQREFK